MQKVTALQAFFLTGFALLFSAVPVPDNTVHTEPVTISNIAGSEKRILPEDPARDEKLLLLSGNDRLMREIIDNHSLIVGSRIELVCRQSVYAWLTDNIRISAALARIFGRDYRLYPGSVYEYYGEDGEGMSIDFYRAYRDTTSTIFIGKGKIKIFLFTISGSFINFSEYYNTDSTLMNAQNCIYVNVNNRVTRFFANIIIAISDIEESIMEKILSLDDTVYRMVETILKDPYLYLMLKEPERPAPDGASELAVKIKNTVVKESSIQKARELGQLIEKTRISIGYQQSTSR